MKKVGRIKGADKLKSSNRSSVLVFDDPGAAAAYAAQEAFAAGVSPAAVMHTAVDGAGNGDEGSPSSVEPVDVADVEVETIQHSGPPQVETKTITNVVNIVNPEAPLQESIETPEDDVEVEAPEVEVVTPAEPEVETKNVVNEPSGPTVTDDETGEKYEVDAFDVSADDES